VKEEFNLIVENGEIVTESGSQKLDLAIRDGVIVALSPNLERNADRVIDASNRLVFPGFIDAHTHMGIPIMNTHSIDDFDSGSIAAAFGGITSIVDFTVQEKGQILRESVEVRLQKAQSCHVDYSLHVNVTDQAEKRLSEIPDIIADGFSAFKVFSTYRQAGMMVTWDEFGKVLKEVNSRGGLVCLHAEDNELVESLTAEHLEAGRKSALSHARSRTPEAEAKAISLAAEIAGELGAALYVVHVSSHAGLEAGLKARARGVKIYLETCPQYLVLSEECYERENGHRWITTPPLRTEQDNEALWQSLAADQIDVVATDHCPFTLQQKDGGRHAFHLTPNGLPGVETLFPLLYTYGVETGRITLPQMVRLLASNPARIFNLARKGKIEVGADADLVIWDPSVRQAISASRLHGNADWSPYEGMNVAGKLEYTILRGQVLVENDRLVGCNLTGRKIESSLSGRTQ
jgi:dihydropyrimidinase